ncbi:MAG: DNA primase small subunit domain-containing protein [Candidatus Bathyarchaeia archaeon]
MEGSTRERLSKALIKTRFHEYYKMNGGNITPPKSMGQREFGFLLFTEGVMLRHKAFNQALELRKFIEATVPSDIYYSAAYYRDPEAPMDKKGWIGSDLIFDIDADHIDTECKSIHDKWTCEKCGVYGRGKPPQECPKCKGQRFREETWMCRDCLEEAKVEALKLIDLLRLNFGINLGDVNINFSGHRGYHVHVESEILRSLGSDERKEIVDYLTGVGLDMRLLEIYYPVGRPGVYGQLKTSDPGWRGRIARRLEEMLLRMDKESLEKIGLKKRTVDSLIKWRETEGGDMPGFIKNVGRQTWQQIIQGAVSLDSVNIDTVVTTDIHRLIRLPGTLNGKTGLKAVGVDVKDLPKFNPLKEAVAFSEETIQIHVEDAPRFEIGGEEYGPFKDVNETLPAYAAILLLCKGVAYPVVKPIVQ